MDVTSTRTFCSPLLTPTIRPSECRPVGLPTVRLAQVQDWKFLDHLQRKHHDAIGFLPRVALERAIVQGHVMLAIENGEPAGYVYSQSPYQRRKDIAIIFQAAICFDARRRLLGTALVESFLARFPPTVRQVCLWCASDLDASLFWSALGFVAVAWRDGARSTGRKHLFWCRHLGEEMKTRQAAFSFRDGSAMGFWVPESTRSGVIRESRAVTRLEEGEGITF
jgi:hypothetical protein